MSRRLEQIITYAKLARPCPTPTGWEVSTRYNLSIWPIYEGDLPSDKKGFKFFTTRDEAHEFAETLLQVREMAARKELDRTLQQCSKRRQRWQQIFDRVEEIARGEARLTKRFSRV